MKVLPWVAAAAALALVLAAWAVLYRPDAQRTVVVREPAPTVTVTKVVKVRAHHKRIAPTATPAPAAPSPPPIAAVPPPPGVPAGSVHLAYSPVPGGVWCAPDGSTWAQLDGVDQGWIDDTDDPPQSPCRAVFPSS